MSAGWHTTVKHENYPSRMWMLRIRIRTRLACFERSLERTISYIEEKEQSIVKAKKIRDPPHL